MSSVMAHTMTAEDYRKAQEAGFSVQETESGTIVTVLDKIKVQLAKAGVDVSEMGGSLTKEQIEAIGGSVAAVNQLEQCFANAELPASEENMTEGLKAYRQAEELKELSEAAIKYMLDNRLQPSIDNLYLAQSAINTNALEPAAEEIDADALRGQMEQVIASAGSEVNEQAISDSVWMIKNGIPYTADNFTYMQKLLGLKLPPDGKDTALAIAAAVAEGGRPGEAMLLPEYSVTAQAEHAVEVVTEASDEDLAYLVANNLELTIENLEQAALLRKQGKLADNIIKNAKAGTGSTDASGALSEGAQQGASRPAGGEAISLLTAKRILEETRLVMTTEANRALLKQGISIDTKPLEALVEQLKQQENNYYAALLKEDGEVLDPSKTELFAETTQKVTDLKQMPAYVLGIADAGLDTVNRLHEAGSALQKELDKAGERYETLMTQPRRDLGDSIQKAFSNTEDILKDLGLSANEANKRAVRILAYNSLAITEESVLSMKAADERVQRAFASLTPAVVREFIREGRNPLDMDLDELNRYAQEIRNRISDPDTERFSEYLWKLEQDKGISPEERESFIGVYRLINQVEKTDGAVIGALVSQGAEFTMRNLLTAVRSAKKSGMDYKVDDEFDGIQKAENGTKSITEQIETAYQADCMKDVMETLTPVTMQKLLASPDWEQYTPEQLKQALAEYAAAGEEQEKALDDAYMNGQLAELKEAAVADDEVYHFLSRYEIPNTINNILAANRLINRKSQVFSRLFRSEEVFSGEKTDFAQLKEEILGRFANALKTPKEMAAAQEALAETAENVMKTMISEDAPVSSMDIRELKLMNAQLSIAGKMAKEEQYTIPVLVGGEVTNMSLKIVRGAKKKGMVEIMFETAKAGKIAACIEAKEKGVSGYVAVENQDTKALLSSHMQDITKGFGEETGDLQVTQVSNLNFARFSNNLAQPGPYDGPETETYEVQTARLYKIAKSFIEHVKELEY